LEDNEVVFDEHAAAAEVAPKTWGDVEKHMKSMDELKKTVETLKGDLHRLTAELDSAKRLAETKTRLSDLLEKELSKSQKFADRVKQIVLAKNETIRTLLIEKRAAVSLESRLLRTLEHSTDLSVSNECQRRELDQLRETCSRFQNNATLSREQLEVHTSMLAEKELTVAKMAQKLIDLKNRLSSITSVIGRYKAMRLYRIYPSAEAQLLVIHDGPSGERRLDVIVGGKNSPHPASTIQKIEPVPNTLDRFNIIYSVRLCISS
jgi:chromosome segregation ATPase